MLKISVGSKKKAQTITFRKGLFRKKKITLRNLIGIFLYFTITVVLMLSSIQTPKF